MLLVYRGKRRWQLGGARLGRVSSVSETYGNQEGSEFYGHFRCNCYHPLFCFNQHGDVERALLREGNVHSADDWRSVAVSRGGGCAVNMRQDEESAITHIWEIFWPW